MTRLALAGAAAFAVLAAAPSCSSVPADARFGVDAPSGSEQQFGPVADFLGHRCGTLDCHGQTGRNLRIWSCEGMRLDPNDIPRCNRGVPHEELTTRAEHQATYRSLVGLEPVVMSVVVDGKGQHPELLTFIRKSRGIETHKGGTLMTPGDYQDNCVTSWLQGNTNRTACSNAILFPSFPMDASTE
jgi:hypothetical protein